MLELLTPGMVILLAVLLDALLGETPRWHPLVGFGRLAAWVEQRLNHPAGGRLSGLLALTLLLLPALLGALWLEQQPLAPLFGLLLLYLAIGQRSLMEHLQRVADAHAAGDLITAREQVGRIVSRDTHELDADAVARSAIESALENGSDAIFAALFWFALAGIPGVVLYRLANTLDAMWGYRNARFERFGWAAASLDDLLNLLPARLTALSYALMGSTRIALRCWREQARHWDSPNAGPVMAAGAGALEVSLGGVASYGGTLHNRATLGQGGAPQSDDIYRAMALVQRSVWLWLGLLLVLL